MKIKLDENIGGRGQELLGVAGRDGATVCDRGMGEAADDTISAMFRGFPPEQAAGNVVLDPPHRAAAEALLNRLREFLKLLETRPLKNELWITELGRVRVHRREEE